MTPHDDVTDVNDTADTADERTDAERPLTAIGSPKLPSSFAKRTRLVQLRMLDVRPLRLG